MGQVSQLTEDVMWKAAVSGWEKASLRVVLTLIFFWPGGCQRKGFTLSFAAPIPLSTGWMFLGLC